MTTTPISRVSRCHRQPGSTAGTHATAHSQSGIDLFAESPTTAISPVGVNMSRALDKVGRRSMWCRLATKVNEVEPLPVGLVSLEVRLHDGDAQVVGQSFRRPLYGRWIGFDRGDGPAHGRHPLREQAVAATDIEHVAVVGRVAMSTSQG